MKFKTYEMEAFKLNFISTEEEIVITVLPAVAVSSHELVLCIRKTALHELSRVAFP